MGLLGRDGVSFPFSKVEPLFLEKTKRKSLLFYPGFTRIDC